MDEFKKAMLEAIAEARRELENGIADHEREFPHFHMSLDIPGFTKASKKVAGELMVQFPDLDELDLQYENKLTVKRVNRPLSLGAFALLYRQISAVDPDTAATKKHKGISLKDLSESAERQNANLVRCLGPYLPAYLYKNAYDEGQLCFKIATKDALRSLLNNFLYSTLEDCEASDNPRNAEDKLIDAVLSYGNLSGIAFPKLDCVMQPGDCAQLYFAGSPSSMENVKEVISPAAKLVDLTKAALPEA